LKISESLLYWLVKKLYSTEVGRSNDEKSALQSDEAYAEYRLSLVQQVTDAATRFGVPIKDRVVLDLGCYDGAISMGYLAFGASHVIGVDIDAEAVANARKNYQNDNVEFHVGTIEGIPLSDNSVDTIVCYDVFEHVEKPAEILKEINRILKPGGKIIIGTWGWKHPFAPHLWSTMPVPYAHVFFSEKTILRVCRRVYMSDWYQPTLHDIDDDGNRKTDKYLHEEIPTDYLNKYLVSDFEKVFAESDLEADVKPQPFGSRFASWTRIFLGVPWLREFIIGYLWVVLTKPEQQLDQQPEPTSKREAPSDLRRAG